MGPRDDPPPSNNNDPSASVEETPSPALEATPSMCHHCFDVLLHTLKKSKSRNHRHHSPSFSLVDYSSSNNGTSAKPDFLAHLPSRTVECPLFVTWTKRKKHRFELRGCIGTLSPRPLETSIGEYALISALSDKRFSPVSLHELPHLRVAVSLLVKYEPCDHCHDWSVGIHGIIIKWSDPVRGMEYSATYLPEVASEQGWGQETAVESLIRKAGYHGRITGDLLKSIDCTRYQSSKRHVTFDEYVQERGGHDNVSLTVSSEDGSSPRSSSFRPAASGSNCIIS